MDILFLQLMPQRQDEYWLLSLSLLHSDCDLVSLYGRSIPLAMSVFCIDLHRINAS